MKERTNQEVLKDYEDSLHAMQYLGSVSPLIDLEMKRIYGEVMAEIMERKLLVDAAEVYLQVTSNIPVNSTPENIKYPGPHMNR